MKFVFKFIEETTRARCYESKKIGRFWIPRSVVTKTLKFTQTGLHEIDIPDWKAEELGLTKDGEKD